MNEKELRDRTEAEAMICHTDEGFYFIETVPDVPLEQQAKDNGELNGHITHITTPFQRVLWERKSALDDDTID
jgi:hypothetical protein